jgi:hypothetical protein
MSIVESEIARHAEGIQVDDLDAMHQAAVDIVTEANSPTVPPGASPAPGLPCRLQPCCDRRTPEQKRIQARAECEANDCCAIQDPGTESPCWNGTCKWSCFFAVHSLICCCGPGGGCIKHWAICSNLVWSVHVHLHRAAGASQGQSVLQQVRFDWSKAWCCAGCRQDVVDLQIHLVVC